MKINSTLFKNFFIVLCVFGMQLGAHMESSAARPNVSTKAPSTCPLNPKIMVGADERSDLADIILKTDSNNERPLPTSVRCGYVQKFKFNWKSGAAAHYTFDSWEVSSPNCTISGTPDETELTALINNVLPGCTITLNLSAESTTATVGITQITPNSPYGMSPGALKVFTKQTQNDNQFAPCETAACLKIPYTGSIKVTGDPDNARYTFTEWTITDCKTTTPTCPSTAPPTCVINEFNKSLCKIEANYSLRVPVKIERDTRQGNDLQNVGDVDNGEYKLNYGDNSGANGFTVRLVNDYRFGASANPCDYLTINNTDDSLVEIGLIDGPPIPQRLQARKTVHAKTHNDEPPYYKYQYNCTTEPGSNAELYPHDYIVITGGNPETEKFRPVSNSFDLIFSDDSSLNKMNNLKTKNTTHTKNKLNAKNKKNKMRITSNSKDITLHVKVVNSVSTEKQIELTHSTQNVPSPNDRFPGCGLHGTILQRAFDCSMFIPDTSCQEVGVTENPPRDLDWHVVYCPKAESGQVDQLKCAWLTPKIDTVSPNPAVKPDSGLAVAAFQLPNLVGKRILFSGIMPKQGSPNFTYNSANNNTTTFVVPCSSTSGPNLKNCYATENPTQMAAWSTNTDTPTEGIVCTLGESPNILSGSTGMQLAWMVPTYPMLYLLTGGGYCDSPSAADKLLYCDRTSSQFWGFYAQQVRLFVGISAKHENGDFDPDHKLWSSSYWGYGTTQRGLAVFFQDTAISGTDLRADPSASAYLRCASTVWY